jgi:hypothetical protein
MKSPRQQSGSVLIVVVVLLLLAGILTLFALNTGIFEQKASGNDLKTKLVGEVADAGLAQGMEYLHQNPSLLTDSSKWTACSASDTTFPCGTVPAARRSSMYYWSSGGFDFDGNGSISGWEQRMLPIDTANKVTSQGNGMTVNYGVGAVICRVASKTASSDPTVCTDSASASPTSVITVVSVAAMPGESARTTVTQSVGSYNLLGGLAATPPILASGNIDITGGMQVVTNPNSAGAGVPVSVWTRKSINKTGTANTCYYNEFLHNSSGGANGTVYTDPASPNYPLCDNCSCGGSDSLSFDNSGNNVQYGIDILQNSGANSNYSAPLASGYANYDVKPQEFPCDLFQQIFRVQAWRDTDGDYFCETKIMTTYKNPNTGVDAVMGADEAYLFQNAKTIVNPTAATTSASLAMAQQLIGNGYPSSSLSGLVWCQQNCDVNSGEQIGSAASPVLLVIDGSAVIKGKIFGLVFLRTQAKVGGTPSTITPSSGYTMTSSEVSAGGNAELEMHGGAGNSAVVYGSIVVQGAATKLNGSNSVVYNADVMQSLLNDPSFIKFGGVPGGWTDRVSY